MRGLIGAETLRHRVPGLTRRVAAAIKTDTCRAVERERRADAEHLTLTAPGILRAFDAMDLGRRNGFVLVAADGCVPYRTSWAFTSRYNGPAVAEILRRDFDTNGAPLVLRMDRARAHDVPAVRDLLDRDGVLELHGPAYYAPYYGQLERQNREHRQWMNAPGGPVDLDNMMAALNGRWRRSTLGWSTAEELWKRRPVIDVDRNALAEDVHDRATRLRYALHVPSRPQDMAWRIAVKQALVQRGLLKVEKGGWC